MSDVTNRSGNAPVSPGRSELDAFLANLKKHPGPSTRGRLIFALDATASREATWDTACKLQADMFREAGSLGSLEMQLVFYRGLGECRASRWMSDSAHLAKTMSQVMCRAGQTQIEKVLNHASKETKLLKVSAGAARQLAELLKAVAVFATGGLTALADQHSASAIKLLGQLK